MEIRSVTAARGWRWIVEGFLLFRMQPLIWIVLLAVMVLIWLGSTLLPPLGPLAVSLMTPVFVAGLMSACLDTDRGKEPAVRQLFGAFRSHAAPLVTIGGIYLVGNIVAVAIMLSIAGPDALQTLLSRTRNEAALAQAMEGLIRGLMIGTLVFMPVLMAVWFAPVLVIFRNATPADAMKSSFVACWRNMLPFTVYGVAMLVLWILATLPLMLGFIVLLPVLMCSIYTSYKDIYGPVEAATTAPAPAPE